MPIKNFDAPMKNLLKNGEDVTEGIYEEVNIMQGDKEVTVKRKTGEETITYSLLARRALCTERQDDKLQPEKRGEYGALAIKLLPGGDIELTAKEITTIRERVGQIMPPMFVAQMNVLLDAE